jgi:hypothetical protein
MDDDAHIMEIGRCVEFYISKRQFIGENESGKRFLILLVISVHI